MKRDWDLVRKILLACEELGDTSSALEANGIEGSDAETVSYHMSLLIEAGLIKGHCSQGMNDPMRCFATSLTWEGHEFLDKVRSNNVWNKVKAVAREKGISLSLDVIKIAAKAAIEQMLQ